MSKISRNISIVVGGLHFLLLAWNIFLYLSPSLFNRMSSIETFIVTGILAVCLIGTIATQLRADMELWLTLITILYFVCCGVINTIPVGFLAMPILCIVYIYTFRYSGWTRKLGDLYELGIAVLFLIYIYWAIQIMRGSISGSVTFNYNTIAEMLLVSSIILFIRIARSGKKLLAGYAIVFVACFFVLELECRSAAICGLLFIALNYFKAFQKKPGRIIPFAIIICIIGTLIPVIYVTIYEILGEGNVEILGKDLFTGRQHIWISNLENLTKTPITLLFGTNASSSLEIYNSWHNMYLMILIRFGIVGTLLFWSTFLLMFWNNTTSLRLFADRSLYSYTYICLVLLVYGFSEVSFLWIMFSPIALSLYGALAKQNQIAIETYLFKGGEYYG